MEFPAKLLERLDGSLYGLMNQHEPNYNGADWVICGFCRASAQEIRGEARDIKHDSDCLGIALEAALKDLDFDDNSEVNKS